MPSSRPAPPEGIPLKEISYTMLALFCTNPVLARVRYINRDSIETTRASTTVLGEAVHAGLKAFLGGDDSYPILKKDTDAERLKYALDATAAFIEKYPEGFIEWKKSVPTRGALIEKALRIIPGYIREWDRSDIEEDLFIDRKISKPLTVRMGNRNIELPIPLVGYPDYAYRDQQKRVCVVDHKIVTAYSDPDAIDGAKLIQAAIYYLLVAAETGEAPYSITFREYKSTENADRSSQTREYEVVYAEQQIVFDLFFRLYEDLIDLCLGKAVFLPNIRALFDREVGIMAYAYRLDEPENVEKEKKRVRSGDLADVLRGKMAKSRNLQRFMEAKASLFTSHISLNYKTMQPQEKIKYKLMEHGMAVNFADRIEGLSVDLYRFEPSVGIKMSTLEKYTKDLEQVLGATGVRILAPIPETNLVGVEVPRKKRQFVTLPGGKPKNLTVMLGVDVYNNVRELSIVDAPHILMAGTTGSGKSVGLHSILTQLSRLPKHEVRFTLLDPKMVELSEFQEDAHVDRYEDDPEKIAEALAKCIAEMDRRYALFKKKRVRNIKQYREKVGNDVPYMLVVVDEFGDLTAGGSVAARTIKECMVRLAQKSRAAGIHLVITTQSPRAKVVDGAIKANFPVRIAYKTVSRLESEIVLDRAGAELLLGKGDMLLSGTGSVPERLQGFNLE